MSVHIVGVDLGKNFCSVVGVDIGRGIHEPRIDIPHLLQRGEGRRMIGIAKLVGGGLMNWHRNRTGFPLPRRYP